MFSSSCWSILFEQILGARLTKVLNLHTMKNLISSKRKNLISTLVHCVLSICSKSMLQQELENIRVILCDNDYPESMVGREIFNKLVRFQFPPNFSPNKCIVYLKLPWIGNISLKFENKIKSSSVKHCFRAAKPRVLFSTRKIFPTIHKDAVPSIQQSMVVYEYICRSDGSTWVAHLYV